MDYLWCGRKRKECSITDVIFLEDLLNMPPENITTEQYIKIINILEKKMEDKSLTQSTIRLISNLAIIEETIPTLIDNNVIRNLIRCMKEHEDNWIIQWMGASALWNLCRNETARTYMKNHMSYLVKMLKLHKKHLKVTHTVFGCLSNCALNTVNLKKLSEIKIFDIIGEVINDLDDKDISINRSILSVCGALIANSSVSSEIDYRFLDSDVLFRYINRLKLVDIEFLILEDSSLLKHSLAAIHNISTCNKFHEEFTKSSGYEYFYKIYSVLEKKEERSDDHNEAMEYIDGMLNLYLPRTLRPFRTNNITTSLHICCDYNYHKILLKLLYEEHANLYSIDRRGDTILHKSVRRQKFGIITFLCAIGFNLDLKNNEGETIFDLIENIRNEETKELIETAIELGVNYYVNYRSNFADFFLNHDLLYPTDLIKYIFKYVNIYEIQYLKIYN